MELIAIPDLGFGAMENWGLVTYRETYVLVDPQNTSTNLKQRIGLVVAHELAHQWFGNLVTMEWWTGMSCYVNISITLLIFLYLILHILDI